MSRVLSVRLSEKVFDRVHSEAESRGLSVGDWARLLIESQIERIEGDTANAAPEREQAASKPTQDGTLHLVSVPGMTGQEVEAATKRLNEKWAFLVKHGKFTGSASEYASFLQDAESLGLRPYTGE